MVRFLGRVFCSFTSHVSCLWKSRRTRAPIAQHIAQTIICHGRRWHGVWGITKGSSRCALKPPIPCPSTQRQREYQANANRTKQGEALGHNHQHPLFVLRSPHFICQREAHHKTQPALWYGVKATPPAPVSLSLDTMLGTQTDCSMHVDSRATTNTS